MFAWEIKGCLVLFCFITITMYDMTEQKPNYAEADESSSSRDHDYQRQFFFFIVQCYLKLPNVCVI